MSAFSNVLTASRWPYSTDLPGISGKTLPTSYKTAPSSFSMSASYFLVMQAWDINTSRNCLLRYLVTAF